MNFMFCGAILKALPGAKITHMQRNPLDTCFSNYKDMFAVGFYFYSYDLADCAAHYKNYRKLMQAWNAIGPAKILSVRYESLVGNLLHESKRIFNYLGLNYSSDLIEIENNKTVTSPVSFKASEPTCRVIENPVAALTATTSSSSPTGRNDFCDPAGTACKPIAASSTDGANEIAESWLAPSDWGVAQTGKAKTIYRDE